MGAKDTPPRKPGRPRDPDLEARRRGEILDAAEKAFASTGFAETDVQVIADQLGLGKGTVYRYFPTKKDLFLATVDRGLADLTTEMETVITDEAIDPVEMIRHAFHTYLRFFARRPELTELFFQERVAFQGRETPRYFSSMCTHQSRDEEMVKHLIAAGRLRPVEVEHLLTVLGDLLFGTVLSNHLSGRTADPVAQADAIVDVLFHGILTDRERKTHSQRPKK
ncbi:TetR/AcrR family transcriptional regulator [Limnoglobus roseus]|uniref:TetR/AcrR family transcriptional regulator n=1 Tax=Limnoglobus roseus TaxID=2598579 RepID=A0A5C1ADK0_9BACT|nr:TetR/AcrR family transcriptional regulator [Limnoglobus roseus]QEL16076.1 TetR/AcrR family transcriptional regulator [Limnoglobus roseus]